MARRTAVRTDAAPVPAGPYSQAVRIGDLVAVAGQVGIDPATGALVSDDLGEQVAQTFRNVAACLEASGAGLDDVLRVDVYLTHVADFAAMNSVYGRVFTEPFPARTTVYVGLPPGVKVEITVLAVRPQPSGAALGGQPGPGAARA
jgi:2-iminobutanoate/2-iminopropanoate deaminase